MSDKDSLTKASVNADQLELVTRDYEEYLIDEIAKNLSDMEKKVFVLRFMEGFSYREVAKELNLYKVRYGKKVLDQKSVDNAIWRSRPKIKKALERLHISPKAFEEEISALGKKKPKKEKIKIKQKKEKKEIKNAKYKKVSSKIKVPRRRNVQRNNGKRHKNN